MTERPPNEDDAIPPLSPPPPAVLDDETAQLVDESLARRHSRGWNRHSLPLSPLSPNSRRKKDEETDVIAEASEDAVQEARPSRFRPSRTITSGSVKLEGLKQAEEHLKAQKVLYRYAEVYENQRG